MYEAHFGLRQRPFRGIPDIECYYPATSHEQAVSRLLHAIHDDEGLMLLTGEPGTGKTVVGHVLIDRLGEQVCCAFLTNSHFADRAGMLQALNYDLRLPHQEKREQDLRLALTDFLLKNYESAKRTVLVIDEAQHLTPDLLEELRLLGNLEGKRGKAIQVVLLALPGILETLELRVLAAFDQRLAVRIRLEPLGLHESADYLVHQLRVVGATPDEIVSDEALQILARGGRGIPRLLNRAAHQAFSLAHSAGESMVDAEATMEALTRAGLSEGEEPETEDEEVLSTTSEALEPEETMDREDGRPTLQSVVPDEKPDNQGNPDQPRDPGRARRLFASPRRPAMG